MALLRIIDTHHNLHKLVMYINPCALVSLRSTLPHQILTDPFAPKLTMTELFLQISLALQMTSFSPFTKQPFSPQNLHLPHHLMVSKDDEFILEDS